MLLSGEILSTEQVRIDHLRLGLRRRRHLRLWLQERCVAILWVCDPDPAQRIRSARIACENKQNETALFEQHPDVLPRQARKNVVSRAVVFRTLSPG